MSNIYMNQTISRQALALGHLWTRFVLSAEGMVTNLVDGYLTWRQRAKDRMHLQSLDDRLLRDIGVSLADVENESSKPFWRS